MAGPMSIDDAAATLVRVAHNLPRGSVRLARTLAAIRPSLHRYRAETRYGPFICDMAEMACYPLIAKGEFPHWRNDEAALRSIPLTRESVVLDIGANIGVMTRLFAERAGHVHAFEPSPRALDLLRLNAPANCTIHPIAIGEKNGSTHLAEVEACDRSHIATNGLRVPIRTIDSLDLDPDFIKIDVEGYEPQVLRGSIETLKRGPIVMFEALTPAAFEECCAILLKANPFYRISDMGSGENFLAMI
jgi:FkbM family methyltransferase